MDRVERENDGFSPRDNHRTILLAHNVHRIALPPRTNPSRNIPNLINFNDFHPLFLLAHKLQSPLRLP
jgi:hypothetical protein